MLESRKIIVGIGHWRSQSVARPSNAKTQKLWKPQNCAAAVGARSNNYRATAISKIADYLLFGVADFLSGRFLIFFAKVPKFQKFQFKKNDFSIFKFLLKIRFFCILGKK